MKKSINGIMLTAVSTMIVSGLSGCGSSATTDIPDAYMSEISEIITYESDSNISGDEASIDISEEAAATATTDQVQVENPTESDDEYYNKLKAEVTDSIEYYICDDFDGDGSKEAFAIVGTRYEDYGEVDVDGAVYYVDDDEVTNISEDINTAWGDLELIINEPNEEYVIRTGVNEVSKDHPMFFAPSYRAAATAVNNLVFGVKDGKAYRLGISEMGACAGLSDGTAIVTLDCYDGCSDGTGHTWKPYYYFYNKDSGEFEEYEGREITEEELLGYEGTEKVVEAIKADGNTIAGIILRDNGIINVNFYDGNLEDSDSLSFNHNATFRITDGRAVLLKAAYSLDYEAVDYKESDYGGVYFAKRGE
ncbi:hypothetical protein NXH67_18110 [Butyrivibrio sp. DSM 10294]|uniref:hypothetical protein n=1 Tax=Butyrivibrio sp. DSM 10294 TaxID=2972457 RepID=UPI00234F60F5|nr:hypothetical protein [Butyrivibrio sp. DSM 10294]MDC7295426.1 hypothetical protein [Butyrivibrio sp. DSM 10294]